MGCNSSSNNNTNNNIQYNESSSYKNLPSSWLQLFSSLLIQTNEVKSLYKKFKSIDKDHSNSININEFFVLLDIEYTRFNQHIFSIFDVDHTGTIDFREFVLSLWNYCTLCSASMSKKIFYYIISTKY